MDRFQDEVSYYTINGEKTTVKAPMYEKEIDGKLKKLTYKNNCFEDPTKEETVAECGKCVVNDGKGEKYQCGAVSSLILAIFMTILFLI